MGMTDVNKVIVVQEKTRDSLIRDAGTVAASWAMIFPGWLIGSNALQFMGAVLFMIVILVRSSGLRKSMTYTPEEALAEIQKIIKEREEA
jgi:hypothetical protein